MYGNSVPVGQPHTNGLSAVGWNALIRSMTYLQFQGNQFQGNARQAQNINQKGNARQSQNINQNGLQCLTPGPMMLGAKHVSNPANKAV